jgi:hypothetical protein
VFVSKQQNAFDKNRDAPYEIFLKKSKGDEALGCGRMLLCLSPASKSRLRSI